MDFNLRIGITFLYAHWEGFVKESTVYYINFLRNQNYTYGELTDCFVGWTLKPKIKLCSNHKISLYYEVIDILVNKKNELAEIPPNKSYLKRHLY